AFAAPSTTSWSPSPVNGGGSRLRAAPTADPPPRSGGPRSGGGAIDFRCGSFTMRLSLGGLRMVRLGLAAGAALLGSTAAFGGGTVDPVGTWNTGRGPMTIEKVADGSFTIAFEK